MIVTAVLAIVAISKPDPVEYVDIEYSPGAIPVDCNNIQTTPLKLKALYRTGGSSSPYEVFWKLSIQSVGTELGTAESPGTMSEWEYLLPSDRWGNADTVVIEAYQESSYKTLLARKSIGISRQNPTPFPVEGRWKSLPFKYKNGEYFLDDVKGLVFMWMNPVPGNSEKHPFYDVQDNPLTTSWKQYQEYPLLGTKLLLAQKIDAGQIDADGIKAKDVNITGTINADKGTFKNGTFSNCVFESLRSKDNSFVYDTTGLKITGTFSIDANGYLLKLDPKYSEFRIYEKKSNKPVVIIQPMTDSLTPDPRITVCNPAGTKSSDLTMFGLSVWNGLNQASFSNDGISFSENGATYKGYTGRVDLRVLNALYFKNGILYDARKEW